MDNLEKQLTNLPQAKLARSADLKIKLKLYLFIIGKIWQPFVGRFVFKNVVLRRTLAIAMMVIMIVGGTAFYAYADNSITEGHVLYPLKRAVEVVEKQVAFSQPAKVRTHEKLAERRLQEALILSQKDSATEPGRDSEQLHERIKKSLDEAVADVGSAVEKVKQSGDQRAEQAAAARARDKEQRQSEYLETIAKNADARHDEELIKKVRETKEAMRQYRRVLEKNEDQEDEENKDDESLEENKAKDSAIDGEREVRGLKVKSLEDSQKQEERTKRRQQEQAGSAEDD